MNKPLLSRTSSDDYKAASEWAQSSEVSILEALRYLLLMFALALTSFFSLFNEDKVFARLAYILPTAGSRMRVKVS